MELRALEIVVAIADQGGVARAAQVLHLSPSTVSHALTKLEGELGQALFHRLPRGMRPTPAGEALLEPARRVLREAEGLASALEAVGGLLGGHLHVVGLRTFSVALADLVGRFHTRHPLVVVTVHQPDGDLAVAQRVRSGECELGVVRSSQAPDDLDAFDFDFEQIVVLVPDGHRLAGRPSVRAQDLAGEPLIAPSRGSVVRRSFERFLTDGERGPVVAEADHYETTLELVRAGVGVTVASFSSAGTVTARGVHAVALDPPLVHPLALVTRRGPLGAAARAFRELALGR